MPTFNLSNNTKTEAEIPQINNDATVDGQATTDSGTAPKNIDGLSAAELQDPNAIKVVIQNPDIPIVVFFGPPTCGKTMTLIRLSRFLKGNGYDVVPVRSFRPAYDSHYCDMCDNFNIMINSDLAQEGTNHISFMLVEISHNGRPLCQILEAPGEHYFNPSKPNAPFPAYINVISASRNRKLWAFFVEPDHTNGNLEHEDRLNYVERIQRFRSYMHPKDKVTIVFNKIDETDCMISRGAAKTGLAIQKVRYSHPGLFEIFANQNPVTKLWKTTRADFVPYMNGYFTDLQNGGHTFQLGDDNFPRALWQSIMKSIKG